VVIADTGICGIDEFDKLDETDRTSIHEVMEQQTVSVSKAGLNVQLNARTAILAAANPSYGRYDTSKSVMQNVNLPHSLMSRFDLQFLMLDNPDEADDKRLAEHILQVHQKGSKAADIGSDESEDERDDVEGGVHQGVPNLSADGFALVDPTTLRHFVMKAQTITPIIPEECASLIQQKYVDMRVQERLLRNLTGEENSYTTPRTLFSIVRLAQARARLRFSDVVSFEDIEEAVRLMAASKRSISEATNKQKRGKSQSDTSDPLGNILEILRKLDRTKSLLPNYDGYLSMAEAEQHALPAGYSKQQIKDTVRQYAEFNLIWFRDAGNEREFGFTDRLEQR